jgi:hypothetical protein
MFSFQSFHKSKSYVIWPFLSGSSLYILLPSHVCVEDTHEVEKDRVAPTPQYSEMPTVNTVL